MWKKMLLAAVATLGIAGAAHADEPCNTVVPSSSYQTYQPYQTYDTYQTPVVVNPYLPVARFDRRADYLRMRERMRWERMRRIRWEREHRGYGRGW